MITSIATSAFVQANDPGYKDNRTAVTKTTVAAGAGDDVTVNAYADGLSGGKKVVVVLTVNAEAQATSSVDQATGVVRLNGTGSGKTQFLLVTLSSTDILNWTVYVNTSGGSTYRFVKGDGGK